MTFKKLLPLTMALLMFPQLAQTLYSPALGDIGRAFDVAPERAGQTLSVYFLAFALGVVVWGRLSDRLGRRPVMLMGLAIYVGASALALTVTTFNVLLLAQACAAFGAAVGSVVTQTVLRDRFHGADLAQVFSVMGIALAASPAIGLFSGASLVEFFGYRGVLCALLLLALSSGLGAWLNKALLKRGLSGERLVVVAAAVAVVGSLLVLALQHSWLLVWPMLLVVLAFGMAIPNVLGAALVDYRDRLGTAAALFGLLYYLVIGGGLALVTWSQDLGWSLLVCGLAALWLATSRLLRS